MASKEIPVVNLCEINVCAPDDLAIRANMRNEKIIAEWWARVSLYVRCMQSLDRLAVIHFDNNGEFYLSSVPDTLEAPRA